MEAAAKAGLKSWPELAGKIPRKILKLINKFGSLSGSSGADAAAVLNEDANDDEDEDEVRWHPGSCLACSRPLQVLHTAWQTEAQG